MSQNQDDDTTWNEWSWTSDEKIEMAEGSVQKHPPMSKLQFGAEVELHLRKSIQMEVIHTYDPDLLFRAPNPVEAIEPLGYDDLSAILRRIQSPRDLALELENTRVWMISAENPKTQADLGPVITKLAKVRLTQLFRALLSMKAERKWVG